MLSMARCIDPDAYLSGASSPAFDPDAYLSQSILVLVLLRLVWTLPSRQGLAWCEVPR